LVCFSQKNCCNCAFSVSDSLPLVQLKHNQDTFCSQPETNHMLNRLATSILWHKMQGWPRVCLKYCYSSFLKTFMGRIIFFPVTCPVCKTFAYFTLVLCTHYAIDGNVFTVGFQFNFCQIIASFSAGGH